MDQGARKRLADAQKRVAAALEFEGGILDRRARRSAVSAGRCRIAVGIAHELYEKDRALPMQNRHSGSAGRL